jgi:hypothetical protein
MESEPSNDVIQIGEAAGTVWHALADNGPLTMAKLIKAVHQPRDTVMLALGWLAREGKIVIQDERHKRTVSLR